MTVLLGIHSLSKSFGTQNLFSNLSFTLSQGDRVGLIGPNGMGKSTLLKILMSEEDADEGYVSRKQGLRIGYASQSPEFSPLTLEETLLQHAPPGNPIELLTRARILLGKAQFADPLQNASLLSGGWKKRLDLMRALMQEPDLLLLDEPTNHLDLEGILWLEKFLMREKISYLLVSHDRYFLENVCNKIIEINRCYPQGLFVSTGNMSAFMERKEAFLEGQANQERALKSQLKNEIDWLRRSPKARTTKSVSRIERTHAMMEEFSALKQRNKVSRVDIEFSASERETQKLLVGTNLTKSLSGKLLFQGLDIKLSPGTRLGIVGRNGTGKTTLLKILSGQITPDKGTLKMADDLKIVVFDQHREHLPPHITLREALSPNGDTVNYRGQQIHVNGWAKKFLFPSDRLSMPINKLSGGERARILIARLMLEPADLLFLDEPTNDLDIPTLEIIEESLCEFRGAVVLISHDRCLMDRVCTQLIGLGIPSEHPFYADYAQWEKACADFQVEKEAAEKSIPTPLSPRPKKLSYKEQKELDGMEASITAAEQEITTLQHILDMPTTQTNPQKTLEIYKQLGSAQEKLDALFERWEWLQKKQTT